MHDFIPLPEAAEMLGVTQAAVRQAVQRGEIIGGKMGGRYIVSKQSVEGYKPREYPRETEKKESDGQEPKQD